MRHLILIALASTVTLFSQVAAACSCLFTSEDLQTNVREGYIDHSIVVLVEATSTKESRRFHWRPLQFVRIQEVQWKVLRSWKGGRHQGDVLISVTMTECCACGVHVEKGEKRILYLQTQEEFSVSTCTIGDFFKDRLNEQMRVLEGMAKGQ